jgi:hypothetical protein
MSAGMCEEDRDDVGRTTVAVDTATRDRLKRLADRIGQAARPPRRNVTYDEVIQRAITSLETELREGRTYGR